ncbi:MAG: DUF4386 domain-containing protein [Devosia sp.]|mgnify:CR=1 FL=1|uniref:DUF4386 domain-containing protein n=1 Tax=Devosia sp. TaxID=1871048 RepID=UPI001AC7EA70|nr:DUF4386 domain-containing protein [Devosia sp.]MBN9317006.1 DUF4386 domain-containing protein [Devosia sp.]
MSTIASTYSPAGGAAARPAASTRAAQKDTQLLARLTGLFFLVTYATSIPPYVSMYVPALSDPAFVLGGGFDQVVSWGALLELVLILANIATALTLYPVLRRRFPVLSLGFVTARLTESAFIGIGIIAVLALNTLRLHGVPAGADEAGLVAASQALVAVHDWTFRLGPGVVVGIGNGLILGYMMWKTRLVPRALSILGLIGGPALLVSGAAVVLGLIEAASAPQLIATIPEFFWELGLGLWLLIRGFSPAAVTALERTGAPIAA